MDLYLFVLIFYVRKKDMIGSFGSEAQVFELSKHMAIVIPNMENPYEGCNISWGCSSFSFVKMN